MIQYNQSMPLVQLLCLILYKDKEALTQAKQKLAQAFSDFDFEGKALLFTSSEYYHKEMGQPLYRLLLGFDGLYETSVLAKAKNICHDIESSLCLEGKRQVNLDIGYLDFFKVVLASFKYRSNKLYLGEQIWGDWQLYFHEGKYLPFTWSFPDMQETKLQGQWQFLREIFKAKAKQDNQIIKI